MNKLMYIALCALLLTLVRIGIVAAAIPNCNAAPYGASVATFVAYEKSYRQYIPAHVIFKYVCLAKFYGGNRTLLYARLNLSDSQIDKMSVGALVLKMINTVRTHAHRSHVPQGQVGVYAPFACNHYNDMCSYLGPTFDSLKMCENYARRYLHFGAGQPVRCFFRPDTWQP